MHPILYSSTATAFENLGLGVLAETLSCTVVEEINGIFNLELEYPVNGVLFDQLKPEMTIKSDAGHQLKGQLFIINRIDMNMNKTVTVYADHISYLTEHVVLKPTIQNIHGHLQATFNELSNQIADETSRPFRFTGNMDEGTENETELNFPETSNVREALVAILEAWGGEYTFDNLDIKLSQKRGTTANTLIAYGRNLLDLSQEENIAETVTSIYPFATYQPEGEDEELVIVTLPELVLHAENADNFANRRVMKVDLTQEIEGIPSVDKLMEVAENYLNDHQFGVPQVSITLNFVDLTKMVGLDGLIVEQLNLGDTVRVHFEHLAVIASTQVVRVAWNVLLEQYDEIELGEIRPSLSSQLNTMSSRINNVSVQRGHLNITGVSVFHGTHRPEIANDNDLWFEPVNGYIMIHRRTNGNWQPIMSNRPSEQLLQRIEAIEDKLGI